MDNTSTCDDCKNLVDMTINGLCLDCQIEQIKIEKNVADFLKNE